MLARQGTSMLFLGCLLALSATAAAEPVRLKFVFSASDPAERDATVQAVGMFNHGQEQIVVEPISRLWKGYGIHDSYVRYLSLQDPAVDVYKLDLPWVPEFADPGWLLPLDGRLSRPATQTFLESALQGGRYGGKLYALPSSLKGNALFYRADLLAQHGFEPPRTLPELGRQARQIQARDGIPVGLALHGLYLYNDFLPMLWGSGGELLRLEPERRSMLREPSAEQALAALMALFEGQPPVVPALWEPQSPWSTQYRHPLEVFERGDAVFVITWSPNVIHLEGERSAVRGKVGVTAIPGTKGPGPGNLGSYYLAVNRASRHPDEAVRFIEHMTSAPVQRLLYRALRELPSRQDVAADRAALAPGPHYDALRQALSAVRTRPRVANEREVGRLLETALQKALGQGIPVDQALDEAADAIDKAVLLPRGAAISVPKEREVGRAAPDDAAEDSEAPWVLLGTAAAVAMALLLLLVARRRYRLDVVTTLSAKLILGGLFIILELMLVAVGIVTTYSLRAQRAELRENSRFLHRQMNEHALTIGKNLALASSIIADLERDSGPGEAAPAPEDSALTQLMMASHFSDELLFLQLVDNHGCVAHTGTDAIYRSAAQPDDTPAGSADEHDEVTPECRERADPSVLPYVATRNSLARDDQLPSGESYVEVYVPVFQRGVHLGALRLGISKRRLDTQLSNIQARHNLQMRDVLTVSGAVTLGLLLLGAIGILLFSRRISRPVVELTDKARLIRQGDLSVSIEPRGRDEIGTLAITMNEMVHGLRDRDRIRDTLGRYVTEEVAERFLSDPESLELGGHLQEVTILMSDIRGFTAMSERLDPETLIELLNRYLGAMTEVIQTHGGTIDEFIGDAILALFGAPEQQSDDAERAVRCAVAMQRALTQFNRDRAELGLPELRMGIGVNTGTVIAGNIGSERRAKYGVVGAPVNLTARVESFSVGGDVLLSESTYELVREMVEVDEPLEAQVKGSAEPLKIYPLRGVVGRSALAMPASQPERRAAVSLPAECFVIRGKEVEPSPTAAEVVELSVSSLVLRLEQQLAQRQDLKLRVELEKGQPGSDWYGKVKSVAAAGRGFRVLVVITSLGETERQAIEARLEREA